MASPPPALEILGTTPLPSLLRSPRLSTALLTECADCSARAGWLHGVVGTALHAWIQPSAEALQDGVQRRILLRRRRPAPRDGGLGLGHRIRLPHARSSQGLRAPGPPRRRAVPHRDVPADLPEVVLVAGEECYGLARRHRHRPLPALPEEHVQGHVVRVASSVDTYAALLLEPRCLYCLYDHDEF
jgi:hypothetical protein